MLEIGDAKISEIWMSPLLIFYICGQMKKTGQDSLE